jgi:2'-5' RNA ligase
MAPLESALVLLVPEAEAVVKDLRELYDPSAAAGVPAHITLLYPFKHPARIDDADFDQLVRCAATAPAFDFSLTRTARFPGVLYFVPEPDGAFRRLIDAICRLYPEIPPYGGKYPAIVPHLTVAQLADERQLDLVAAELLRLSEGKLPIIAAASEMALLDAISGRWEVRATFKLG